MSRSQEIERENLKEMDERKSRELQEQEKQEQEQEQEKEKIE